MLQKRLLWFTICILAHPTFMFSQSIISKANTGIGLYVSRINWINWDINNDGYSDNLKDVRTKSITRTYTATSGLKYKITLSDLKVYTGSTLSTSGIITDGTVVNNPSYIFGSAATISWTGNNFTYAYGGLTTAGWNYGNIICLSNLFGGNGNGNMVTFRLSVEVRDYNNNLYNGNGYATGIVLAGTESLSGTGEWESYAVQSGGKFQIIDKYIYNNNWNDFNVKVFQNSSTDPTQMIVSQNSSAPTGDRRGDIAILASNTPYVDCKVKGSGGQSIALGFIEDANFSQAPAS